MDEKIIIGLIGTGAVAQIAHIPFWKKIPEVELLAVCDKNKTKAQLIAEKFKIPYYFSEVEELFKLEPVQVIDICVPTRSHMELTVEALSAGKHVIVEKPMARNFQEAERMVQAAEKNDKKLMVAMNVRFRNDARILKTFAQSGELGDLFYFKSGWLRAREKLVTHGWFMNKEIAGGGVFMDLGIQLLDLGLWLMGNVTADSVKATTFNKISHYEVEDTAFAFIRLNNGAILNIEVSWTLPSLEDFFNTSIFGTHGTAILNPLRIHKELHGNLVNVTPAQEESPKDLYKKSYQNELLHFVRALQNKETLISTGKEHLERMRIIDAIYQSAKTGREVILG